MEKRVDAGLLLSFYGAMLTERQQEMLRYYYEDDLSLSEIAMLTAVSRQGVHDAIRRGEQQLFSLEERLGLRARWQSVCLGLSRCRQALEAGNAGEALTLIDALLQKEEARDGV